MAGEKTTLDDPMAEALRPEERSRYVYPQVRVIQPGGPYFKMPWERIHKVSIATMTVNMALDLENREANENGTRLEAVTKDQLNTGLTGQIRYRVSEANLYAFIFGIKKPFVHVLAYFVSVLRQRIAQSVIELEVLKLHALNILTKVERGEELGFGSSMTKLQWSETHQDIGELYLDVVGADGWTARTNDGTYGELFALQESALWSRSETIWGGSSQVQRNIVAEHVLGLPR